MSINFKTATLVLSRQLVTATGNNLYVNGLLVGSGIYSTVNALAETGSNLYNLLVNESGALNTTIAATGQQAWTAAQNNAVNLSGNLASTGQQAWNAAQNNALNLSGNLGATGALLSSIKITGSSVFNNTNWTGVGTVNIWASGSQIYVSGNNADAINLSGSLASTGQQAWNAANNNGINLSGNLTQTGVALVNQINSLSGFTTGISGYLQSRIALASAGVSSVNGQSGTLTVAGTGGVTVISGGVGLILVSGDQSISGALTQSGVNLLSIIFGGDTNLSGNLTQTGVTLRALTLGGDTNLSGNLTTTGQTLYQLASGTSGNLSQTGATLLSAIASTGQQAWLAAQNNALNLSGALTATGVLLSAIKITGSNIFNVVNFTGVGTTTVWISGAQVYVSGNNADAINISGNLAQTGATLLSTIANTGQQAWNAANNNGINLSGNLTQTGVALSSQINSLSGFTTGVSGYLLSRIALASAGVSSLNGQSGAITIAGTGGLTVISGGVGLVLISGDQSISGALTQSGVNLLSIVFGGDTNISGNLTQTGITLRALTIGGDTNLSGNLTTTGQTLYQLASGTSGNLSQTGATLLGVIASSGQQAWIAAQNNAINLSGNLTATGQTLFNLINGQSGYAEGIYVHRTGIESITGTKTFLSELRFNSGLKTPVRFFGPGNTTLTSGDYLVIATGTTASTTGILPAATDYSGVPFALVNGGTISLQISGVIGPDTNPILAPWDAIQAYATSGQWWYIRQTGSPLLGMITSLSGFVGNVSGALQTNITANAVNISGNMAQTGATLLATIASTGQQAWAAANNNGINLSGNLTVTGQTLYQLASGTSGNLSQSGATLMSFIIGGDTNISGNLTQTGITLRALTLGGDTNLSGNLTTTGQTLYNLITNASGQYNANYAPALANYFYTTGVQTATDIKTFGSEIRLNSGLKTPATFFGPANYTLGSGNLVVVATGALTNTTGILPVPATTSGNLFILINGGTTALQISGNIGPDVNPTIQPNDAIQAYAVSGAWYYIRQTGSPLTALVIGISGNLTQTGVALLSTIASTGQAAWTAANSNGLNLSGNLTTTGQTLYQLASGVSGNLSISGATLLSTIFGGDANLSGNLTQTGITLRALTLGGDTNLSGNLTTTGQTLYNLIANLSGVEEGVVVHRTGAELVTGTKTFLSELRFNSGIKTPTRFFGPGNTTLTSGDYIVIATGNTAATTGIFPSATDYSGVPFVLVNGGTASLQISGVLGPDTNPILAPWDVVQTYATSGQWWYLRQTGSPLLGMITSLSGFVGNVSGALQTNITANATNLSGGLTQTGVQLQAIIFGGDTNLSGNLTLTGQTLRALTVGGDTNLSGNLTLTGQSLYQLASGASGNLSQTGATLMGFILGGDTNLSGNLTQTGATLFLRDAVISGAIGTGLTLTGQTLYNLIANASGTFAPALVNYVYQTGVQLITGTKTFASQINVNSGIASPVRFFGPANTTLTSGDWTVISTGTTASTTGILPSPTAYSGTYFNIVNGGTVALQISGTVGATTNPVLSPFDGLQLYATSGQWWSLASTGSPLTSLVIGISGNLSQTGATLGAQINSLSGFTTGVSGYLQGQISAVGGVTSLNRQVGALLITGSGGLTVLSGSPTLLIISGDQSISGFVTSASGGLEVRITATGNAAVAQANGVGINLSGNLMTTGQTLYQLASGTSGNLSISGATILNFIFGGDTNLSGNLTLTGQTLRALTLGGDTNLSGNLTVTGQTLYNLIANASGTFAPASANYVYQTGIQSITGIKTFASQVGINSGITAPARFFGPANYTPSSGDWTIIATGTTSSTTGILPSPTAYSGTFLNIINGGTVALQISGTVGGLVNPVLAPFDGLELYATSGQWWSLASTGSPLTALVIGISGNLTQTGVALLSTIASTGQQAWVAADTNARNLSGNMTLVMHRTGAELISGDKTFTGNFYITSGNVGIGTIKPSGLVWMEGDGTDNQRQQFSIVRGSGSSARITMDHQRIQRLNSNGTYGAILLNPSGGNVGIGTASPNAKLEISGGTVWSSANSSGFSFRATQDTQGGFCFLSEPLNNGGYNHVLFREAGPVDIGSITSNGTVTAYNTTSDVRIKDNILPLSGVGNLIDSIKPCTWTWKNNPARSGVGFLAQELVDIIPDAVTSGDANLDLTPSDSGYRGWGLDMSKLMPYLVAEIQSLRIRVGILEYQLTGKLTMS